MRGRDKYPALTVLDTLGVASARMRAPSRALLIQLLFTAQKTVMLVFFRERAYVAERALDAFAIGGAVAPKSGNRAPFASGVRIPTFLGGGNR